MSVSASAPVGSWDRYLATDEGTLVFALRIRHSSAWEIRRQVKKKKEV